MLKVFICLRNAEVKIKCVHMHIKTYNRNIGADSSLALPLLYMMESRIMKEVVEGRGK